VVSSRDPVQGGLGTALKTVARRSAVPVDLDLDLAIDRQLPGSVEVGAYYVVSEAVTNTAKNTRASVVKVGVETEGANIHLSIRDDGIGGAADNSSLRSAARPSHSGAGTPPFRIPAPRIPRPSSISPLLQMNSRREISPPKPMRMQSRPACTVRLNRGRPIATRRRGEDHETRRRRRRDAAPHRGGRLCMHERPLLRPSPHP
jgi:hypothetical protein